MTRMMERQGVETTSHRPARAVHSSYAVMPSRSIVLPGLLLALGMEMHLPSRPQEVSLPIILFTFDRVDEADWFVVNDGVMGGRSSGFVAVEEGRLRFTGVLVTQGGGFTSARARREIDLTGEDGLELRVRGSGRPFEVELDDGVRRFGRTVSRRAPIPTTPDWTVVRVPFSSFRSSIFGQSVETSPIDLARIRSVGLYMLDGRDGPFQVEVDEVRTYRDPAPRTPW